MKPVILGLAISFMVLTSATLGHAEVQCACPNVPAVGVGNTSCSASESSGECTVDFNLFGPQREKAAAELIERLGVQIHLMTPDPHSSTYAALVYSNAHNRADAVLVYSMVAAADQRRRMPETISQDDIREISQHFEDNRDAVSEAFSPDAANRFRGLSDDELDRYDIYPLIDTSSVIIMPGCIEITSHGGLWVMFKALWSPSRIFSQCSPE